MPNDLDARCRAIVALQAERKFVINLETSVVNSTTGHVASFIAAPHDESKEGRGKRFDRAKAIVSRAMKGKPQTDNDAVLGDAFSRNMSMVGSALEHVLARRAEIENAMDEIAKHLPVAAMTDEETGIKGFKARGLAVIIGEAGNLSNYSTVRKLWRRLGFGMAQGHEAHAYSTWRRMKGLSTEEWTSPEYAGQPRRAGYSPKRLGQIYGVVTTPLFMNKAKSKYGTIYDARRAHTLTTHPEWYLDKKGKPKLNATGAPSSAHAMEDAKRVMTKELLSDLWSEWRRSCKCVDDIHPDKSLAASELIAA